MTKMISIAKGFQYSINIGYDLYNDNKIKNFIPTTLALSLLEKILLSTAVGATNRTRILIGAYGKGKSHIILMILSILLKRELKIFEKLLTKLEFFPKLKQLVNDYYKSNNKILPVIITGSNISLSQAFLLSLQRTLSENNLLDLMPETNYQAAILTIKRWKNDFPETLLKLENMTQKKMEELLSDLENYDIETYKIFEESYPFLTSGSKFNPFLGFDIVELYETVAKNLKAKGYSGIYVVYDEFSKYLESNIRTATISDTKMLQDFAEKCSRSGDTQLHLMLISHKEISNYIDKLPKQKIDGWRGISERFEHIHLNNNFSQTYEIIGNVIHHNEELWKSFYSDNKNRFISLYSTYKEHPIFSDVHGNIEKIINDCYPLHPVSIFILPRLSEKIAQNERTLFTFLSSQGENTLSSLLEDNERNINFITADRIYDYFETLFQKEIYSDNLYNIYILTQKSLEKLEDNSLEQRIVKTLSLIYILEQFEKLAPSQDEIYRIFSLEFSEDEIKKAINNLIESESIIYLKRSNGLLKLKESSGINIREKIIENIEKQKNTINIKEILNSNNFNSYLYPSRYNDEKEMIRYFLFEFINTEEFKNIKNWDLKLENVEADGVIFAILTDSDEELKEIIELLKINSLNAERCVFVILRKHCEIKDLLLEFNAVMTLKKESIEDKILFSEYEVIYEDLLEVIYNYIFMYMHPENKEAIYIYMGEKKEINKKSELTELLSKICDKIYFETPIINNEAINRRELTSLALTSRNKIIAALLRNELELNLGLIGNGQEVSIMRSTLIRTGILVSNADTVELNFNTEDTKINNLLSEIIKFIFKAKDNDKVSFQEIYDALLLPKNHIALRKGLIPIFLAVVFHKYKKEIIIKSNRGELPLNVDTIEQIDASPKTFYLHYLEWDEDKKNFIFKMENLFKDYIIESEKRINSYNFIVFAMKRWYMSLPKVTKELKRDIVDKEAFNKNYLSMLSSLRIGTDAQNLLFKQLVKDFSYSDFDIKLVEDIKNSKDFFDNLLFNIKKKIIKEVKILFLEKDEKNIEKYTLFFIIKQWLKSLKEDIYTQTFVNGTDRCLFLFKNITEDEELFINKLSKLVTDLNIEDWNQTTYMQFKNNLIIYKETAESYVEENKKADNYEENLEENQYKISFFDESEKLLVKKFKKIEKSPRAKLLYNSIEAQLEAMGQSLSEQEKRQVLIEILCKLFQ